MDPLANLREQRKNAELILKLWDNQPDSYYPTSLEREAFRLAELVQALDEWMKNGGFSPWN